MRTAPGVRLLICAVLALPAGAAAQGASDAAIGDLERAGATVTRPAGGGFGLFVTAPNGLSVAAAPPRPNAAP